jgi:hypothetical protein
MEIMRALSDEVHLHRTPQGTTVVMEVDTGLRRSAPGQAPGQALTAAS